MNIGLGCRRSLREYPSGSDTFWPPQSFRQGQKERMHKYLIYIVTGMRDRKPRKHEKSWLLIDHPLTRACLVRPYESGKPEKPLQRSLPLR